MHFKCPVKVREIIEARLGSDLNDRAVGRHQQKRGVVQPKLVDIADKCVVHKLLEQMRNIIAAYSGRLGNLFKRNTVAVMLVDVVCHS